MTKSTMCAVIGVIGAWLAEQFGGWTSAMTTLVFFMGIDYVSGLVVGGVFKNSPKSENGALESRAGWKGLIRKCATFIMVLVAARLDMMLGTSYVKDAVIIAFCANELLSIIENVGLMGVTMPKALTDAIEILKNHQTEQK